MTIAKAKWTKCVVWGVCSLLLWAGSVTAQVDTGSIVGTVHDPTGAVLEGAKVTVTDLATTTTRTTQTDANGQYVVTAPRMLTSRFSRISRSVRASDIASNFAPSSSTSSIRVSLRRPPTLR
jgi:hypothetical protein